MIPKPPSLDAVLTTLTQEGLLATLEPTVVRQALLDDDAKTGRDTPAYVRGLMTAGTWAAGSTLIGLFLMLSGLDAATEFVAVGVLLMVAGVMLGRQKREVYSEFAVQAALVAICAGDVLTLIGIADGQRDSAISVGFGCILLGGTLLWLYDQVQLRTGAALQVFGGLAILVVDLETPYLIDGLQTVIGGAMVFT